MGLSTLKVDDTRQLDNKGQIKKTSKMILLCTREDIWHFLLKRLFVTIN